MAPQTESYEGPLDLLLDEVRRQKVAIERIAMAPIVARFLEYMRTAAQRNLALDIEWLHMAATLIEWKSRALLPSGGEPAAAADPIREELVRQILAHGKHVAAELDVRQAREGSRFPRGSAEFRETPAEVSEPAGFVTVWDLMEQARELGRWVDGHREACCRWRAIWGVEPDDTSVAEMTQYLRELLDRDKNLDGMALLMSQETPARRSCLFLGMLEMARDGECQLVQNELFGSILVMR